MMMSNFFMFGTVVLFFLIGFLHIYAAFIFKKNEKNYEQFVREYEGAGLQLDLTTRVSGFMGFYANYQKISFFMRLYHGVKMRFSRNEYVKREAYEFVQNQSIEKIGWMVSLHKLYKIIFSGTAVFGIFLVVFVYVLN
ncbi:hypothetical protein [Erwinia sp. S59]|uniref:hypothetical protein n=1 Tax=Erwinia sp. S59 TaxID=2769340 RepID=UPI00190CC27C|nr:hypothetical protein [Erwinia sp. S59]MBK0091585.1 hypothetical protein [Erwinia sp. S59]